MRATYLLPRNEKLPDILHTEPMVFHAKASALSKDYLKAVDLWQGNLSKGIRGWADLGRLEHVLLAMRDS